MNRENGFFQMVLMPRVRLRVKRIMLMMFFAFTLFTTLSQAEYFEVAPDVSEWQEGYCKAGTVAPDIFARCRATGGTPQGSVYNFDCIGGDPVAFANLPVVEQVELFSYYRWGLCATPSVSFSGYGHPPHDTFNCWSTTNKSIYGLEYWSTGNMLIQGQNGSSCSSAVNVGFSALRTRTVSCPAGSSPQGAGSEERCYKYCPEGEILIGDICTTPDKDDGCNNTENPCNVATGKKYRSETDFSNNGLNFTRSYNSNNLGDLSLGRGWRSNYQKALNVATDLIVQVSTTGRSEPWVKTGGTWVGDADSKVVITENATGFQLVKGSGAYEDYDLQGRILSETDTNGHQTVYTYNADGQLGQVMDHYGRSLIFNYAGGDLSNVIDADGEEYHYEYDAVGNLIEVVMPDDTPSDDSDNPRKTYHYEDSSYPNHLTGITDENGDRFGVYAYDLNGKVVSSERGQTTNLVGQEQIQLDYTSATSTLVTDAIGTQELWTFDEVLGAKKLLSKINQVDSKGITQTWDANGNRLTRTDAEGRTTSYTYNATNQKTSMTEAFATADARTTTYEYVNADVDVVTKTISPSVYPNSDKEVINSYDANLNITGVTITGFGPSGSALSRSTTFSHDVYGKVTSINGPRTDVTDTTTLEYYDCNTGAECGQLKKVTNALGHISTYDSYDGAARLLQSTDANGTVTTYTYHPRGWMLSMTQTPTIGTARVTTYEYDNVGQLTKTTLPDGSEQNYVYDAAHDLREISDNLGNKITYTYDAKGNRTDELVYDPDGTLVRSTITAYDMRNFVESINAAGSVTQLINDAVGNLTSQMDPNGNPSTQHQYDALNRLQQTIDALGNTSSYQYDVHDQLTQVTAPNNAQTTYSYDDLGNLLSETSADRGLISYQHDAAGNVISHTDARNVTTNFTYDALNRLTQKDYPGTNEDVLYTYDLLTNPAVCAFGTGRLCEQSDNGGTKRYSYDAFGNVTDVAHEILGISLDWFYSYDDANRVVQITYPSGGVVSYTRDAVGRITDMSTTVNHVTTSVISNRQYRGDGLTKEHQLGNGLWSTRTHDQQGRLLTQTLVEANPRAYNYDANGNIIDITNDDGLDVFIYDSLDRLVDADLTVNNLIYSYDANGNRTSLDTNGQITTNSYDVNTNRLKSIGMSTVSLDAAGNTTADQNGTRTFEYNQAGRLARVLINNVEQARYEYDANGLRINKITPSATTIYQYGLDGKLLTETDDIGILHHEYLYADSELVAVIAVEPGTPTVIAPPDITVEASDVLTPVTLGTATATDDNDNPLTVTADNTGPFPLGETTVTWTASANGILGAKLQLVTIVDTTPPVIVAPADITVSSPTATMIALGNPAVTDVYSVTVANNAPIVFPIGVTNVTWTATDNNGNSATATQVVTVNYVPTACVSPINISPLGIASLSTTYVSAVHGTSTTKASNAINGIFTDMIATTNADNNATWEVLFSTEQQIEQVVLHNRADYPNMLRDIIVSVQNDLGTEVYQSQLLNPENSLGGPASITLDIQYGVTGNRLKVKRVADPDFSGSGSTFDDANMLSFAEIVIQGCDAPIPPTAPTIETLGTQINYADTPVSIQVIANDANADVLTYSAIGLPSGLSIDAQTGLISGSTLLEGSYTIVIDVTDDVFTSSVSFTLAVVDSLIAPAPGTKLDASTQTFTWFGDPSVTEWWIYVGDTVGSNSIVDSSFGLSTSATLSNLPQDGRTLHLSLWYLIAGNWDYYSYVYTAAGTSKMTTPVSGTKLDAGSQTFTWIDDPSVTEWWIYVGDTVGSNNIVDSSFGLSTSATLSNLPQDGRTLYLSLWYLIAGNWEYDSFVYIAAGSGGQ